jgi:hypothetical protein
VARPIANRRRRPRHVCEAPDPERQSTGVRPRSGVEDHALLRHP